MATPRPVLGHAQHSYVLDPPVGARRVRRLVLRSGLVLAAAALTLSVLPGTAGAAPGRTPNQPTPDQLTQMVADASHRLEVVSEQVNQATEQFKQQQAAAVEADRAAAAAGAQVAALDGQIREIARSAYTGTDQHFAQLNVLLTSHSPGELIAKMGTLEAIAGHTNAVIDRVSAAADAARQAQRTARQAEAEAKQTLDDVTAQRAQLQAQIADYKQQYATLTAAQQQRANAATAGRPALAAPAAAAPAPTGAAQTAVNTALAQVGKPYVWGAAGPNAFDCSGLTQYAYAAAGISLPHSSRMQATMGTAVSRSQLQPGDLVFFYSPVSHVAMYIGNGQIVHASTSGEPVKVVALDSMPDYNSARRLT